MRKELGSTPLVSAIIIFLDERQFLQEAIESVFAQTYPYWELLLIDDGSSDGSSEIAQAIAEKHRDRVQYLEHPGHANRGMSASRNLGWSEARGSLIAFLDGDDVWLPGKLERQVDMMRGHAVDMVYGNTEWWYDWTGNSQDIGRNCLRGIGMSGNTVVAPPELMLRCFPLGPAPSPTTCSILVRRETVQKVGGYENEFRGLFEDQAFLAKLYLNATTFVSDECHDRYRMHGDSCVSRLTRAGRHEEATHLFLKWLKKYLTRESIRDPAIWASLRRAFRPYRYPYVFATLQLSRNLSGHLWHIIQRRYNRGARFIRGESTGMIRAFPNPILTSDRFSAGSTTLSWKVTGASVVEVHVNAPDGALLASAGPVGSAQTGLWVVDGTCFYLQDVTDNRARTSKNTLDIVRAHVVPVITPDALSSDEMPPDSTCVGTTPLRSDTALSSPSESPVPDRVAPTTGRTVILLYHRIADLKSDPWTLGVTPERFGEQLKMLREYCPILSLENLRAGLRDGTLPERSVAVTFDDGYADNLHAAKPLLERHRVPATFFVTTGVLASSRDFWWDDVDRLFLQTVSLPRTLSLMVGGQCNQWDLGEDADYPEESQRLNRHWRAWGEPDPTVRHYLFRTIYYLLYPLPENERQCLVDELLAWGGLPRTPMGRRTLTHEELIALGSGSSIEIGAHTVTHSLLVAASTDRQRHEIQQSKDELERILQRPVTSFAYPFGKHGDYSEETVDLVRASGFCSACSNFPGVVTPGTDAYQLPRMFMGNWTADEFATQLNACFEY